MGNSGDRSILVLWLLGISMVTWRELKHPSGVLPGMPAPSAYVGTIIVYGAAALVGEVSPPLGVALAFGWTLALAYQALGAKEPAWATQAVGLTPAQQNAKAQGRNA